MPVEFRTCSHTAPPVLRHAACPPFPVCPSGFDCVYPNSVARDVCVCGGWLWGLVHRVAGRTRAAGFLLTISDIWVIACEFRKANRASVRACTLFGRGKTESFPAGTVRGLLSARWRSPYTGWTGCAKRFGRSRIVWFCITLCVFFRLDGEVFWGLFEWIYNVWKLRMRKVDFGGFLELVF